MVSRRQPPPYFRCGSRHTDVKDCVVLLSETTHDVEIFKFAKPPAIVNLSKPLRYDILQTLISTILVFIAYATTRHFNTYAQIPSRARGLI